MYGDENAGQERKAWVVATPKRYKKLMKEIRGFDGRITQASMKVMAKEDDMDEKILTDVVCFLNRLKLEFAEPRVILSSCDTIFVKRNKNTVIPERILSEFGVECEWPEDAAALVEDFYQAN